MDVYTPISCTFHDHIEHFITLKKPVTITFIESEVEVFYQTQILETYTSHTKEEFMKLKNYPNEIRLDSIISIDDIYLDEYD